MRFVIIGGDAAGMSAASRAKRNRPDLEVVVLEQGGDVSYSACGMPYNIADPSREMEELVVRRAEVFREKQGIDLRLGHRAEAVEPEGQTVRGTTREGKSFELSYDHLLIATGASPVRPDLPGMDLPGVMALKSLEHGRRIKAFLREAGGGPVVIVGMGYIALEMAEAFRALALEVSMVKPRPTLLPWMAAPLRERVKKELQDQGVRLYPGVRIQAIEGKGRELTVRCEDINLPARLVLVAVGVRPNSRLAKEAGLLLGPQESIAVGRDVRTSHPLIYAAGDCADAYHVVTGEKTWIPLALRANRAGYAAGDNVTGRRAELQGVAGTAVFKVFDLEVARTGLTPEEARAAGMDPVESVITSRTRAHAHPGASPLLVQMVADRNTGRILGAQMVGREGAAHRINAVAVALHQSMTAEQFAQCDLAYAPPFGPVWDPLLVAAQQVVKALS